jgi:hypothetical protein
MAKFQVTEVQKALKGADYPMDAQQLADLAESNGAEDELVEALRSLEKKDGFSGPNTVMKELSAQADALGGPTPEGRTERQVKDVEGPAWQVNEVQRYLKGADYPMDGPQLAELAKSNGAEDELVEALRGLREVSGPNTVMKELKEHLGGKAGREG